MTDTEQHVVSYDGAPRFSVAIFTLLFGDTLLETIVPPEPLELYRINTSFDKRWISFRSERHIMELQQPWPCDPQTPIDMVIFRRTESHNVLHRWHASARIELSPPLSAGVCRLWDAFSSRHTARIQNKTHHKE